MNIYTPLPFFRVNNRCLDPLIATEATEQKHRWWREGKKKRKKTFCIVVKSGQVTLCWPSACPPQNTSIWRRLCCFFFSFRLVSSDAFRAVLGWIWWRGQLLLLLHVVKDKRHFFLAHNLLQYFFPVSSVRCFRYDKFSYQLPPYIWWEYRLWGFARVAAGGFLQVWTRLVLSR